MLFFFTKLAPTRKAYTHLYVDTLFCVNIQICEFFTCHSFFAMSMLDYTFFETYKVLYES